MPHSEIEAEEAPAAKLPLDVVAEHPEEDHVAEKVHESAWKNMMVTSVSTAAAGRRLAPNNAAGQCANRSRLIHLVGRAERLDEEHREVDGDQGPGHVSRLRHLNGLSS